MTRPRLLIVGAGLAGTFAAHAAARRGAHVTLLERFAPGHDRGSSHGGSRIFRHAYEQEDYVRLAIRADEGWRELERATQERLLWRAGGLDLAPAGAPELDRIESALRAHDRPVERLTADEVRRRFPAYAPDADTVALFQPDAGVVAADRALIAAARRAADLGAELRFGTPVARLEPEADGVVAALEDGSRIRADRGIVAAGPWLAEGPLALDLPLRVEQQQVVYLAAPAGPDHGAERMPLFIDRARHTYGMGRLEHPAAVKVADHVGAPTIRLAERDGRLDPAWAAATEARAKALLPGLGGRVAGTTCLYTTTPDEDFVIGAHPHVPAWTVAGGFSGHGFKFGPALGAMLAELALDGSSPAWSTRFAPDRFARTTEAGASAG
jgi:sarcosine oxidase